MRKTKRSHQTAPSTEEAYFHGRDAELIRELQKKDAAKKEREAIKQTAGIADDQVVAELQTSGFDRETVRVLHLVPLLQVAWADGEISRKEKIHILEAARLHGVEPGSKAHKRLESWLEQRPSDAFFRKSLRAIRAILHALEHDQKHTRKLGLLALSKKVAGASGGFFGLGSRVSAAERSTLAEISAELEHSHREAMKAVAQSLQQQS